MSEDHMQQDRIVWIDGLRALACVLVILLHSAAPFVTTLPVGTTNWSIANWIDSMTRICVPLFFMISGYFFLSEKPPRARHFLRVLAALGFYSLLAVVVLWVDRGHIPVARLSRVLTAPVFYHLWFFYTLLGIYGLACLVRIRQAPSLRLIIVCLVLAICLNSSITPVIAPQHGKTANLLLQGSTIYYFIYAVAGALLGRLDLELVARFRTMVQLSLPIAFLVAASSVAILTAKASVASGAFDDRYYDYWHALNMIAAFSVFFWARFLRMGPIMIRITRTISDHSLAIYGLHALVLYGLRPFALDLNCSSLLAILALFSATFIITYPMAALITRVDRRRWVT